VAGDSRGGGGGIRRGLGWWEVFLQSVSGVFANIQFLVLLAEINFS
jgi:hypothetical protein